MRYIKNCGEILALLLLSTAGCLADRTTLDETKTQFALPLPTPPTIDGVIDAGEWQWASGATGDWHVFVATVTDADGNPVQVIRGGEIGDAGTVPADDNDLSFTVNAGYDADNLYIAVHVRDSVISTDSAAEDSANGTTWMDDSVEVFIDGDNSNFPNRDTSGSNPSVSGSGGQFVITANNAYRDAEAGSPGYGENAAWFAKTTVRADGTGYDAEFRISLKTIGNPKPGDIIGFTVAVNDDDNGGGGERQVIWVGRPHTEVSYGNLILDKRTYTAPKAASPTVDGVIHPEEYAGAQEIRLDSTSGNFDTSGLIDGLAHSDLNYHAWVVHDGDAIYVAVDVVDDQVFADSAAAGTEDQTTWEDDSVEIFFDADSSRDQNRGVQLYEGQYVFTANGAWRDAEANNPTYGADGDWFAATTRTFRGYQVEFKINKSALLNPADGASLGFNIAVNDDDGAGRKAQLCWDGRPHHEYTYGSLVLGAPVGESFLRITTIDPAGNNLKLTFTTPDAAAAHTVQTATSLTNPQWTTLAGVTFAPGAGTTLTATFPKAAGTHFYRISR